MARRYAREGDVIVEEDNKLGYFFLGLGLGVAVGVLFAPQSGEETRRLIKDKAEEGVDILKRKSTDLQETAAEAIERGKQTLQRKKETLAAAVDAGRQAYREASATDLD
ncbi:MAG: YtxH domain-containing protein [Bryobacteraceae bacterium]|jgi:gas vesicle protein